MKLSQRILNFSSFYHGEAYVYDLCCDHGLIGINVAQKGIRNRDLKEVIFNDQILAITDRLKLTLKDSDIPSAFYSLLTQPAQSIKIETQNNFIIIAGIGGELMIKVLAHLNEQTLKDTKLILCPHNNYFKVRDFVINKTSFGILKDDLIFENKVFYEYLYLTSDQSLKARNDFFPCYYNDNPDENTQKLIIHYYSYFSKAKNHPYRDIVLSFFLNKYSVIIKGKGE